MAPRTGDPIDGLEAASAVDGVTVFAAGVTGERDRLVTAGGRVLAVTGQGPTVAEARIQAYEAVSRLSSTLFYKLYKNNNVYFR